MIVVLRLNQLRLISKFLSIRKGKIFFWNLFEFQLRISLFQSHILFLTNSIPLTLKFLCRSYILNIFIAHRLIILTLNNFRVKNYIRLKNLISKRMSLLSHIHLSRSNSLKNLSLIFLLRNLLAVTVLGSLEFLHLHNYLILLPIKSYNVLSEHFFLR